MSVISVSLCRIIYRTCFTKRRNEVRNMEKQKILAERLKLLCMERKMSYYMLSCRSGVPISTIMNIIHCTTKNPGIFTIVRICAALHITVREFFGTEEFENLSRPEQE